MVVISTHSSSRLAGRSAPAAAVFHHQSDYRRCLYCRYVPDTCNTRPDHKPVIRGFPVSVSIVCDCFGWSVMYGVMVGPDDGRPAAVSLRFLLRVGGGVSGWATSRRPGGFYSSAMPSQSLRVSATHFNSSTTESRTVSYSTRSVA